VSTPEMGYAIQIPSTFQRTVKAYLYFEKSIETRGENIRKLKLYSQSVDKIFIFFFFKFSLTNFKVINDFFKFNSVIYYNI
jgi:hypothetical protein